MRALPYCFLILAGGLSLAIFLTSNTLAAEESNPCAKDLALLL
ncbi:MAG: hypothetical protein AAFP98_05080 [Pseudomonadota bacterium]